MSDLGQWGNAEFEALSWHDVHVHGFFLERFSPEEGAADLVLDIDYILNWQQSGSGFLFTVCQAVLRFHKVFGLKFSVDFAASTAGMCPFSLAGIEREELVGRNGPKSFRWRIPINWPQGPLEFEAPAFTQELVGEPHVQSEQVLAAEKRRGRVAT